MAQIVLLDYWRSFIPEVRDMDLSVRANNRLQIPLNDILIQGAKELDTGISPDLDVLAKVPVQRGWRLNHVTVNEPKHGILSSAVDGQGWTYRPLANFVGQDCFNYYLTNGTQRSPIGKVLIDVVQNYTVSLIVERQMTRPNTYRFIAEVTQPPDLPQAGAFYLYWSATMPVSRWNGVRQRFEVRTETFMLHRTVVTGFTYRVIIINDGFNTGWKALRPDDCIGFIGDSDIPYRATGDLPKISCQINLYERTGSGYDSGNYFVGFIERLDFNVSDFLGERWWESGLIQDVRL